MRTPLIRAGILLHAVQGELVKRKKTRGKSRKAIFKSFLNARKTGIDDISRKGGT